MANIIMIRNVILNFNQASKVSETEKRDNDHGVWKSQKKVSFNIASEWTKINQKCHKWSNLASFWKTEACGQTVLPDRSVFIGQKLVETAKIRGQ